MVLSIVFLSSLSGFASGYNYVKIDGFDFQTSQYFYGVENDVDGDNYFINVCIYDIKNNKTKHIFPADNKDQITQFYYQLGYSHDLNKQVLNTDDLENQNQNKVYKIDYNKASLNLILVTYSKKEKNHSVWICSKSGVGLKKIATYGEKTRIEIDSLFNKILLIKADKNKMYIDAYPY
jgi:hypothetical protein